MQQNCVMAPDPNDPICCEAPLCSPPSNPNVPPTGVVGTVTGANPIPNPTPFPTPPGYTGTTPTMPPTPRKWNISLPVLICSNRNIANYSETWKQRPYLGPETDGHR